MARSTHNAVKAHFGNELAFTIKGGTRTIEVDRLPESTLVELIRYGASRWINDKMGGLNESEATEKANEQVGRLLEGVTPGARASGGGGRALSAKEMALRDVFVSVATKKLGFKKGEADKVSKREDLRRRHIQEVIAKRLEADFEADEVRDKTSQILSQIDYKADEIKSAYESTDVDVGV